MRIAFATCRIWPALTPDDQIAAEALERRGIEVIPAIWDDPGVHWRDFDLIVLRSMWDYYLKPAEFFAWLDHLEQSGTRVVNPVALARWNANKRYLRELQHAGAPVIPTVWVEPGQQFDLRSFAEAQGWRELIVKPVVSAGAHNTRRFGAEDLDAAARWHSDLLAAGTVLVQKYQPEIVRDGEWSLIFIDGQFRHAVVKRAVAGDFRVQEEHGGTTELVTAPDSLIAEARAIVDGLNHDWLYARVDGVRTPDGFRLMELEVLEPGLFFLNQPSSAEVFADAVVRRLR